IAGGWCLNFTIAAATVTTTTLSSAPNPSFTTAPNNAVTFTATVTTTGGSPVMTGTVTLKEGATTLAGPTGVNASGQASFTLSTLTEGSHLITAQYNGTPSFGASSGTVTQRVDNHTIVNGNQFCNSASGISFKDDP